MFQPVGLLVSKISYQTVVLLTRGLLRLIASNPENIQTKK